MSLTTATYFDGISSIPQQIELTLDELQGHLVFKTSVGFNKWGLEEISVEQFGNTLEIRHNENKMALIKVSNPDFIAQFLNLLKQKGQLGWYHIFIHLGIKVHILIAVLILGLIVGGYFLIIPWVAEKAVLIIPEKYDASLGQTFFTEYVTKNNVDSAKTNTLNEFASKLKLNNTKSLHFTVVESDIVNAFALPDGNIVVYTALLNKMKGYDELAGLIGHEVIHVNNRHTMKMLCRNLSGYIFISVVLTDVNGIMAVIADNARNLESLSFSRQFEQEADVQGTELMIQNGINPKGMTTLFTRLKSEEKVLVPTFISSHPMTDDRIKYINELIKNKPSFSTGNKRLTELFQEIKN
jgi:Zn-dependent protease with chaperone function